VQVLAVMMTATVTATRGGESGDWITVIVGVVVYVTATELLLLLFQAYGCRRRGSRRSRGRDNGGRCRSGSGSGDR